MSEEAFSFTFVGLFGCSLGYVSPCVQPPLLWLTGAGPAFPEFVPDFISSPHFSFKSLTRLLLISHGGGLAASRQIAIQGPAKSEAHLAHGAEQCSASGGRGLTPAEDLILRWIRPFVSRDGTSSCTVVRLDFVRGLGGGASACRTAGAAGLGCASTAARRRFDSYPAELRPPLSGAVAA